MFSFKRFHIDDTHCGMKVGTDAVTLGVWTNIPPGAKTILDIGTGSGLIALMMAQRSPESTVDAIECDAEAAADARRNVAESPFKANVTVTEGDIFETDFSRRYDIVVCNPPFFIETLHSPDRTRAAARHEGRLGVTSLIELAPHLLKPEGILSFIAPASRLPDIEFALTCARLNPRRYTLLTKRAGKPHTRVLVEATLASTSSTRSELIIDSEEYRNLTKDFYLDHVTDRT